MKKELDWAGRIFYRMHFKLWGSDDSCAKCVIRFADHILTYLKVVCSSVLTKSSSLNNNTFLIDDDDDDDVEGCWAWCEGWLLQIGDKEGGLISDVF